MKRKFSFELDIPEFEAAGAFSREAVEVDYVTSVILERARDAVLMYRLKAAAQATQRGLWDDTWPAADRIYQESLALVEQACRTLKVES